MGPGAPWVDVASEWCQGAVLDSTRGHVQELMIVA